MGRTVNMQAIADGVRVDAEILKMHNAGVSQTQICKRFKCGTGRYHRVTGMHTKSDDRSHGRGMTGNAGRPFSLGDTDRIKALVYAGWEASAVEDELGITGVVEWHHKDNEWLTANGYCRRCEIKSETELCPDCVREGLTGRHQA